MSTLCEYPEDFLTAAELVIDRLRGESAISPKKTLHACWHLAGHALGNCWPAGKPETEIPWIFADDENPMPAPAGWKRPPRSRESLADELERNLGIGTGSSGPDWPKAIITLAEIAGVFLALFHAESK